MSDPVLDKVSAVADAVKGLVDGTTSAEQADALFKELEDIKKSKEWEAGAADRAAAARQKQIVTERTRGRTGKGASTTGETYEWFCLNCSLEYIEPDIKKLDHGTFAVGCCWKCGQKLMSRETRQQSLKLKVAEMATAREHRAQRREQFAKYQKLKAARKAAAAAAAAPQVAAAPVPIASSSPIALDSGDQKGTVSLVTPGGAAATATAAAAATKPAAAGAIPRVTDYDAWEFWEAESDDEETRAPILPKNDPTFKMMEIDMEQKWAKRRAVAKEAQDWKKAGNDSYAKKDYPRAIELYAKSLECRKDDRTVYSNRAQAYLQLEKFKRALKDCNTALEIFEILEDKKVKSGDGTVIKTYYRRAQAHKGLKQFELAIKDLQTGLSISPDDAPCKALLKKTRDDFAEHVKQQEITEMMRAYVRGGAKPGATTSTAAAAASAVATAADDDDDDLDPFLAVSSSGGVNRSTSSAGDTKNSTGRKETTELSATAAAAAAAAAAAKPKRDGPNHIIHSSSPLHDIVCSASQPTLASAILPAVTSTNGQTAAAAATTSSTAASTAQPTLARTGSGGSARPAAAAATSAANNATATAGGSAKRSSSPPGLGAGRKGAAAPLAPLNVDRSANGLAKDDSSKPAAAAAAKPAAPVAAPAAATANGNSSAPAAPLTAAETKQLNLLEMKQMLEQLGAHYQIAIPASASSTAAAVTAPAPATGVDNETFWSSRLVQLIHVLRDGRTASQPQLPVAAASTPAGTPTPADAEADSMRVAFRSMNGLTVVSHVIRHLIEQPAVAAGGAVGPAKPVTLSDTRRILVISCIEVLRAACISSKNIEMFVATPSPNEAKSQPQSTAAGAAAAANVGTAVLTAPDGIGLCRALLSSNSEQVVAGTFGLLSAISLHEDGRRAMFAHAPALTLHILLVLNKRLPATASTDPTATAAAITTLHSMQHHAATLLTNCAFHAKFKTHFRSMKVPPYVALMNVIDPSLTQRQQQLAASQSQASVQVPAASGQPAADAMAAASSAISLVGTPTSLLDVQSAVLTAIRNFLTDDELRAAFVAPATLYVRALAGLLIGCVTFAASVQYNIPEAHTDVLSNVLQVLYNCAVEPAAGSELAAVATTLTPALLRLLEPESKRGVSFAIRTRAIALLSRCLRQPAVQSVFIARSGVHTVLSALSAVVPHAIPTETEAAAWREAGNALFEAQELAVDSALRIVLMSLDMNPTAANGGAATAAATSTALVTVNGSGSKSAPLSPLTASAVLTSIIDFTFDANAIPNVCANVELTATAAAANATPLRTTSKSPPVRTGVRLLVALLAWPNDKIAGNAALGIDRCAAVPALVPRLGDAIEPILKLLAGAKVPAGTKKNAALAMGKLFAHDPFKEKIRAGRGMEMLFHLTKSGQLGL